MPFIHITIQQARDLDSNLESLNDSEIQEILDAMEAVASLAFDRWSAENRVPNYDCLVE